MKLLTCIIVMALPLLAFPRQSGTSKSTHILELAQKGAERTIKIDVAVNEKETPPVIQITMPGGSVFKAAMLIGENSVKYHMSNVQNGKIATVHYIGEGRLKSRVEGRFNAMVDGVFREDMSGTFVLKRRNNE